METGEGTNHIGNSPWEVFAGYYRQKVILSNIKSYGDDYKDTFGKKIISKQEFREIKSQAGLFPKNVIVF